MDRAIDGLEIAPRFGQRLAELRDIVDHRTRLPVGVIGVTLPLGLVRVDEEARARAEEIFVKLAAGVTQINVGGIGIGHRRRRPAAGVNDDVGRVTPALLDPAGTRHAQLVDRDRHGPLEQHHMRREDQLVIGVGNEPVEDRRPHPEPRRQMRRRVRIIQHHRAPVLGQRQVDARVAVEVELGIADLIQPVGRDTGVAD
jgi:hypothetical protein